MDKEELQSMPRKEKIELLKKFAAGSIRKVGNQYIDMSEDGFVGIIVSADGKKYANYDRSAELSDDFFKDFKGSSILFPDNGRVEW